MCDEKHLPLDSFDFGSSSSSECSRHRVSFVENLEFSRSSGENDGRDVLVHVFR